ncbi:MAG: ThiF family adenylyltransferase [Deltaproteobacteria bacterium]|nr:ThiF family adenylyltransferase [Deltaproteobacteria bacterium]
MELADDRYARQRLIPWWEQDRLRDARVLVVGAGALGNELLKLLALLGAGAILVVDFDRIERSNLSRAVLFRETDEGRPKAEVAAARVRELNPEVRARGLRLDAVHGLGLGAFLWADVVLGGVDNRLARVFVNSACARAGKTWVDGAIEGFAGVVRVFDPSVGACYECTMSAVDRRILAERRSCAMLARRAAEAGHVPNTVVAASIVAGVQVQEAVKLLHGRGTLVGEGLHFDGAALDVSRVRYPRRDDCPAHDRWPPVVPLGRGVADVTLGELLERAERSLGPGAVLDLSRDVITELECPACGRREPVAAVLGALGEELAACPACRAHRVVHFTGSVRRDGELDLGRTFAEVGVPPFDVVVSRRELEPGEAWWFDADASATLGELAVGFEPSACAASARADGG